MFARELGGKLFCIHYLRFQSPPHAPFKYVMQTFRTLQVLFKEKSKAIHVQNPPFPCGLVVYFYSLLSGAKFVFEHHSATFDPPWYWALPIQKFLVRRASTNIVTNQHWADVVESWGGKTLVMFDPFLDLPQGRPFAVKPGFNVAFVSTFAEDEPVEAVLEAARQLPEVNFYITGNKQKKPASFFEGAPSNVTFTGFFDPNGEYLGLLRAVDAVMVLTTRNYTLQLGGCEALAVGKPLITSDFPYLRELFWKGTVFGANTAEGIRDAVLSMQGQVDALAAEIDTFRRESRHVWNVRMQQLREIAVPRNGS
jgi:glycosyltransferase involved in cell wall biosynthesis